MILLSGFLEVIFRAFVFIGLSLSVGGIVYYYTVLRPATISFAAGERLLKACITMISAGAFAAAVAQLLTLVAEPWALEDAAGQWPLDAFLSTGFARAGIVNTSFGLCLGLSALWLRTRPRSGSAWLGTSLLALLFIASGAWLVHGVSRLTNAGPLMTVTVVHQFGAAAWIGGTMHLASEWRLLRGSPEKDELWPLLVSRFSPVAMSSVALLLSAGAYLSWYYIGSIGGLVGTAYGAMVLTKAALMGFALLLGGMNFLSVREWKTGSLSGLFGRTPAFVITESAVGSIILMAAAALTSQPPAVDVIAERASLLEVLHTFAPKMPHLTLPPYSEMLAGASSSLDLFAFPSLLQKVQSDFNHNISGIFVILLGLGALLDRAAVGRIFRHWPLIFLPFALFLFTFAEPNGWPLGKEGFWETLVSPEVLQHRLATILVVGLGFFEWRVRTGGLAKSRWRYAFPLLCGAGGALLLTHSHSVFALKWAYLIEVSHNAIGVLAVLMGAGRWLELRLPGRPEARLAGLAWPVCFMLVGFILLFYREV